MKVIAEIGGSHGRSKILAYQLIEAASECDADYVKFQTFEPEFISADVRVKSGPWVGQSYRDLYKSTMLPWTWHEELFNYTRHLGMMPFSTPFSASAINFLETLDCPIYKIASPEITHLDLIRHAASTRKPLIISTGAATMDEIDAAVNAAMKHLNASSLTLMVCVSQYPALPEDYRLFLLDKFKSFFGCEVGVSDHTKGTVIPIIAASKNVTMLEKHLTLTTHLPDDVFASSVSEFKAVVDAVRMTAEAIKPKPPADNQSKEYRRCVWVVGRMKAGDRFTDQNLRVLRPWREDGIEPSVMLDLIDGRRCAIRDLEPNTYLKWSDIDGTPS